MKADMAYASQLEMKKIVFFIKLEKKSYTFSGLFLYLQPNPSHMPPLTPSSATLSLLTTTNVATLPPYILSKNQPFKERWLIIYISGERKKKLNSPKREKTGWWRDLWVDLVGAIDGKIMDSTPIWLEPSYPCYWSRLDLFAFCRSPILHRVMTEWINPLSFSIKMWSEEIKKDMQLYSYLSQVVSKSIIFSFLFLFLFML